MTWKIEFDESAKKSLFKLDKSVQRQIIKYLKEKVAPLENPKGLGKPLLYQLHGLWRYRVEDYRIICRIEEKELVILVIQIGHRKEIYEKH